MCLSVCHSSSQRLHIRMFFWQSCKREREEEKRKIPKVWRPDLTSSERPHKLFAVCSSLEDWGSSQEQWECKEGRCWRKCRGTMSSRKTWTRWTEWWRVEASGFGGRAEWTSERACSSLLLVIWRHDRSGSTHTPDRSRWRSSLSVSKRPTSPSLPCYSLAGQHKVNQPLAVHLRATGH